MTKYKPKNFKCKACSKEQYTNEKCYQCGGKFFKRLEHNSEIELTVSDIEYKIEERMEKLGDQFGSEHRINELKLLQGWILCGEDY